MRELRIDQENLYDADTVSAVVAASIFASQGGSLLSLSIVVPVVALVRDDFAALAALTRLTRLQVCLTPVWYKACFLFAVEKRKAIGVVGLLAVERDCKYSLRHMRATCGLGYRPCRAVPGC